jgi:hypothetical protein
MNQRRTLILVAVALLVILLVPACIFGFAWHGISRLAEDDRNTRAVFITGKCTIEHFDSSATGTLPCSWDDIAATQAFQLAVKDHGITLDELKKRIVCRFEACQSPMSLISGERFDFISIPGLKAGAYDQYGNNMIQAVVVDRYSMAKVNDRSLAPAGD